MQIISKLKTDPTIEKTLLHDIIMKLNQVIENQNELQRIVDINQEKMYDEIQMLREEVR